jgi:ABC-type transport system involved in cytochrome bd biosynthesis fused ATPase/permease subunit
MNIYDNIDAERKQKSVRLTSHQPQIFIQTARENKVIIPED